MTHALSLVDLLSLFPADDSPLGDATLAAFDAMLDGNDSPISGRVYNVPVDTAIDALLDCGAFVITDSYGLQYSIALRRRIDANVQALGLDFPSYPGDDHAC